VAAETESGFVIDGVVYEVPGLDTLTMDEAQVLYDYSGLGLEDFAQSDNETEEETKARERLFRNPGLMRALMHIAYQRKHSKLPASQIRRLVGAANVLDALQGLVADAPEDEIPLASTSEPNKPSSSGSLENDSSTPPSSVTGGNGSPNGSDVQAGLPRATTATRSATSSTSARESSAA
jgi:hypothetical protein